MSKSVYSLVLSDDVVRAADREAYARGTSRSNLINQILAEYLSYITPEKRMKDIFSSLCAMLEQEPFQVQTQGSDSILSIRSPLRVKYNPTIRYTVELSADGAGELRITARTQSQALLGLLNGFFHLFCQVEEPYLHKLCPGLEPQYRIQDGRLLRRFCLLDPQAGSHQIGEAMARYIQMIDQALKAYAAAPPSQQEEAVQRVYLAYLRQITQGGDPIIL